jgi:hypothetical protein
MCAEIAGGASLNPMISLLSCLLPPERRNKMQMQSDLGPVILKPTADQRLPLKIINYGTHPRASSAIIVRQV